MTKELNISWDGKIQSRIVGADTLSGIAGLLSGEQEIYVVFDENVAWVSDQIVSRVPVRAAVGLETSEALKTMETVLSLERRLLEEGASRGALVLAVGGGITTDLAGFTASIYKRGVRYANVPTTLLAQVDAAIGGKTGVNLDGYKNMLGVIVQPQFTFLCPEVLSTLPPREFRSGLAELVKTLLLADAESYAALLPSAKSAQNALGEADTAPTKCKKAPKCTWEAETLPVRAEHIWRAAGIKADIVSRDPYEKGERMKLNLGHTFAHAIEHEARLRGDDITHGEAVSIGIILAAELSEKLGVAQNGLSARLKADFTALGLPVDCPYPADVLRGAMHKDKKATARALRFVLLEDIARPRIVELTDF